MYKVIDEGVTQKKVRNSSWCDSGVTRAREPPSHRFPGSMYCTYNIEESEKKKKQQDRRRVCRKSAGALHNHCSSSSLLFYHVYYFILLLVLSYYHYSISIETIVVSIIIHSNHN